MSECIHNIYMLNGQLKDSHSFDDSLINKGISFYEVLRIFNGKYLFLEDHIARLKKSIELLNIENNIDYKTFIYYLFKYKLNIGLKEGNIKIVINFQDTKHKIPTNCFIYRIRHTYPSANEYKNGVVVSLLHDERLNPNAKFINLNIQELVFKEFGNKTIYETLFVNEKNSITEGSRSNVFLIKSNKLYTSPDETVLQGVTRKYVLDICKHLKYNIVQESISINSLSDYDAVFLTGTSAKVLPVRQIEDISFQVKNVTLRKIMQAYDESIKAYIARAELKIKIPEDILSGI